jgi:hypothetical protein
MANTSVKARRTLGEAAMLTPDKLAFIHGSPSQSSSPPSPSRQETSPTNKMQPVQPSLDEAESDIEPTEDLEPRSANRSSRRTIEKERKEQALPFGMENYRIPLTTRLRPETAAALKRAGLEQRLNGKQPFTVQEIAEEAIVAWLKRSDYLK